MAKIKWIVAIGIVTLTVTFFLNNDQDPEQLPYKIGVLMTGDSRLEKLAGLKKGLSDLGFKQESLEFIVMNAEDDLARLTQLSQQLTTYDLDVIVTLGAVETLRVKQESEKLNKSIPVVFAGIAAPTQLGLIESYRSPGNLFTGINNYHMNLSAKRLELFSELIIDLERVLVLYDKEIDVGRMSLKITQEAANQLKIPIKEFNMHEQDVFKRIKENLRPTDGLLILPSHYIESLSNEIAQFAIKNQIPSMGIYERDVKQGYLVGYGASFFDLGYQSARHVSLILQGNDPAELPVELPDKINFLLNDQVKNELNIKLNYDLVRMADIYYQADVFEGEILK